MFERVRIRRPKSPRRKVFLFYHNDVLTTLHHTSALSLSRHRCKLQTLRRAGVWSTLEYHELLPDAVAAAEVSPLGKTAGLSVTYKIFCRVVCKKISVFGHTI